MAEMVSVSKNEFLFKQGDAADCMYIVKSGKISLLINDGENEKEVDTASMGQLLGEMSLFDKQHRSAGAKALIDTVLIRLPYTKLEEELNNMPDWVQAVLKKLSEKIREANVKILINSTKKKQGPNV